MGTEGEVDRWGLRVSGGRLMGTEGEWGRLMGTEGEWGEVDGD